MRAESNAKAVGWILGQLGKAAKKKTEKALRAAAVEVVADAKAATPVDSGDAAKAWKKRNVVRGVEIINPLRYAGFIKGLEDSVVQSVDRRLPPHLDRLADDLIRS